MADIELVIKIPEKTVNEIKDNVMFAGSISSEILWDVTDAIVNSTPLPKGHGRLVDASDLLKSLMKYIDGDKTLGQCVDDTRTIVEADRGEKE